MALPLLPSTSQQNRGPFLPYSTDPFMPSVAPRMPLAPPQTVRPPPSTHGFPEIQAQGVVLPRPLQQVAPRALEQAPRQRPRPASPETDQNRPFRGLQPVRGHPELVNEAARKKLRKMVQGIVHGRNEALQDATHTLIVFYESPDRQDWCCWWCYEEHGQQWINKTYPTVGFRIIHLCRDVRKVRTRPNEWSDVLLAATPDNAPDNATGKQWNKEKSSARVSLVKWIIATTSSKSISNIQVKFRWTNPSNKILVFEKTNEKCDNKYNFIFVIKTIVFPYVGNLSSI